MKKDTPTTDPAEVCAITLWNNSSGQYQPEMVVYGPVTLPQNMAYYGAPSAAGANDSHPAEMIRDACQLLDDEIDFREYDLDGDGYIDNVYLFYPGYSQARRCQCEYDMAARRIRVVAT